MDLKFLTFFTDLDFLILFYKLGLFDIIFKFLSLFNKFWKLFYRLEFMILILDLTVVG